MTPPGRLHRFPEMLLARGVPFLGTSESRSVYAETVTSESLKYHYADTYFVYADSGPAAGATYVLLHGIGMGRVTFEGVAETLRPHARVVAMDLPGFGDSPRSLAADTIHENAELIGRFIADLDCGPVVLVGHSMGTQIAAEVAVARPELLEALVLIAPTINRHERSFPRQAFRMLQDLAGESPKVLLIGVFEYLKTTPFWFVGRLRRMLAQAIENLCPLVTSPTLVMSGECDFVAPQRWTAEVAAAIRGAELREIAGRRHDAIIKSAEPAASMMHEFVERLRNSARDRDPARDPDPDPAPQ